MSVVTESTRPISIHFKQLKMKLKIGKSDTASTEVDVVKGMEVVVTTDENQEEDLAVDTVDTSLCANGNGEVEAAVHMVTTESDKNDRPK